MMRGRGTWRGTWMWVAVMGLSLGPALGGGECSLEGCIGAALAENPGVEAARWRIEAARASVGQARSAWYPRLSAAAGYARTDNPPQAFMMSLNQRGLNMMDPGFDPNEPDDTENVRLTAGLKMRLWDGQRGSMSRMAGLGALAAEEQWKAARNTLVHEVTRAYYGALQARAFVAVMEASVASLEESLRVARARVSAGAAVRTDVLNLEVQLAQAREDLIRARNGVRLAVEALNTAVGRPVATVERLDALAEEEVVVQGDWREGAEGDDAAVEARGELGAARRMAAAAEEGVGRARGAWAPVVNGFGTYDWDSEDGSAYEESYMVGVMAEWEVFDGFQRMHAVRQARAEREAARAEAAKARDMLRLDVRQARLGLGEAAERVGVAAKAAESATEALRITREQYERGAVDITVLLTAELGLTATRTRHVAARYDYLTARSNLARARGELADTAGGQRR